MTKKEKDEPPRWANRLGMRLCRLLRKLVRDDWSAKGEDRRFRFTYEANVKEDAPHVLWIAPRDGKCWGLDLGEFEEHLDIWGRTIVFHPETVLYLYATDSESGNDVVVALDRKGAP